MSERTVATTKKPESKQTCSNSCKQNTGFNSTGSSANRILQLQRTAGNQAVQKLVKSRAFQAKLKIGKPDDVYEQEADRVAEQVMRMQDPIIQCKCDKEEKSILQARKFPEHAPTTQHKNIPLFDISKSHIPNILQRQKSLPENPLPQSKMEKPADQERLQHLNELLAQITKETQQSLQLRTQLETLPPASSSAREIIENKLNESRLRLIDLLERRIYILGQDINSLNLRIGPNPASRIGGRPELESLGHNLLQREREIRKHQQQLRPLKLWRTRHDIQAIQQEIEQINWDTLTIPPLNPEVPTSDINDPRARELMERRTELEEQQRKLAASMTSKALRYRQSDPRWGSKIYGTSPNCTNVAAAGCGPTSLAILLNYMFQQDPEMIAGGDLEFVKPPETADYTATHGRVCNNGTVGDTMVTNVHTQWEGFRGTRINLEQAVAALHSGNLVIFLCKSCTGQKSSGGNYTYGGHFMVLNGVNQNNTVFNVLDPAGANIVTISRTELQNHTNGFWTIERK